MVDIAPLFKYVVNLFCAKTISNIYNFFVYKIYFLYLFMLIYLIFSENNEENAPKKLFVSMMVFDMLKLNKQFLLLLLFLKTGKSFCDLVID